MRIVNRQTSDTNYSLVVPGNLFAQSNANANCFGAADTVNCSGSTTTTGSVMPPRPVSYNVRGATFTLQLPDGRLVVVNCESKYAPKGDFINRRSCRMPLVNDIQAEFDGDNAKLRSASTARKQSPRRTRFWPSSTKPSGAAASRARSCHAANRPHRLALRSAIGIRPGGR